MTSHSQSGPVGAPPRVRVSHPEELIAAVPYLLRFAPTDSLVVITLRQGASGSVIDACARFDLAPVLEAPAEAAAQLSLRLPGDGADALWLVYCGQPLPEDWSDLLTTAAAGHGIGTLGCWQVDGNRYRCLQEPAAPWQPTGTVGTRVAAEFVLQGWAPVASRSALIPDLSPAPATVQEMVERVRAATGSPDTGARLRAVRAWHRALAARTPLGPARCGLLHAGLGSVLLRDALLASCLGEDETGVLRAAAGRRAASDVFDRLLGPGCAAPDPERLAGAAELLVELVRCAAPGRRAEPLAVLAWCAWWSGDGASANQYLDLVLDQDPDHRLGRLLEQALARGLRPGWVPG